MKFAESHRLHLIHPNAKSDQIEEMNTGFRRDAEAEGAERLINILLTLSKDIFQNTDYLHLSNPFLWFRTNRNNSSTADRFSRPQNTPKPHICTPKIRRQLHSHRAPNGRYSLAR